jgi:hypothetical protein
MNLIFLDPVLAPVARQREVTSSSSSQYSSQSPWQTCSPRTCSLLSSLVTPPAPRRRSLGRWAWWGWSARTSPSVCPSLPPCVMCRVPPLHTSHTHSTPVHIITITISRMTSGGHTGSTWGCSWWCTWRTWYWSWWRRMFHCPGSGYPQMIILIMLTKKIYMKASKIQTFWYSFDDDVHGGHGDGVHEEGGGIALDLNTLRWLYCSCWLSRYTWRQVKNKLFDTVFMMMYFKDMVLEFMKKELSDCLEIRCEQQVPHFIQHIKKSKS